MELTGDNFLCLNMFVNVDILILLNFEADCDADPIWCNVCGWNLDIDDFPLSNRLKDEVYQWVKEYKKMPMKQHNSIGENLTEKVKDELGSGYKVVFMLEK